MTRRHDSLPASPPRRRLLRRNQAGAAAVEFPLVVGLFVFILYGLIAFGMILATKQRVTNATAEGARAAVGQTNAADAKNAAKARVSRPDCPPGHTPSDRILSVSRGSSHAARTSASRSPSPTTSPGTRWCRRRPAWVW